MALKRKVDNNTVVVKKNSDKSETTLKNGNHVDTALKINKHNGADTVIGMSVGSTLNMQNYESLRVDVWISDVVKSGETTEEAYSRLREVINEQLVRTVAEYKED